MDSSGSGWGLIVDLCVKNNEPLCSIIAGNVLINWVTISFWGNGCSMLLVNAVFHIVNGQKRHCAWWLKYFLHSALCESNQNCSYGIYQYRPIVKYIFLCLLRISEVEIHSVPNLSQSDGWFSIFLYSSRHFFTLTMTISFCHPRSVVA